MNISSIKHNSINVQNNNTTFGCHLTTSSRLRSLNDKYHRLVNRQVGSALTGKEPINSSGLFVDFDVIMDKSGKISNGVYKICKNLIEDGKKHEYILKYLNKFKNKDGFYDEKAIQKIGELPVIAYAPALGIIRKTKDLPENMQQEILDIFNLYDKVHNSFATRVKRYLTEYAKRYKFPLSHKTRLNIKNEDIILGCIKDSSGKYNPTLIKATQALVNAGYDLDKLPAIMNDIVHVSLNERGSSYFKRYSEILKTKGLCIEEVAALKANLKDMEVIIKNWKEELKTIS